MYAFELVRPGSLEEALEALKEEDAQALAGGQTLIPTLKARLAMPSRLVSLRRVAELRGVGFNGDVLCIRAATTHASVAREVARHYPALAHLAGNIGDPAVRNRGTIGGSLANNDPSACYPAAILASGATIVTNAREIPADDFFDGMFTTALEEGELITEVRFSLPGAARYVKFIQPASRFALTGVFVARFDAAVRVAVTGACEEGVFRWHEAEEALAGTWSARAVEALEPPDRPMIDDMHGSADYRAHLSRVLTAQAVAEMGAIR
jgi:aerobic carbon-monoxide dehydrogenase medium subunit